MLVFVDSLVMDGSHASSALAFGHAVLRGRVVKSGWGRFVKGNLDAQIDFLALDAGAHHGAAQQTGLFEFAPFLQIGQPFGLVEHLFAGLAFGLFSLCVGQTGPGLLEHLHLVLVHINGIRTSRFGLGMRINLTSLQRQGCCSTILLFASIARVARGLVQQELVVFLALGGGPSHQRSNGFPLRRHEFG